jgi:hypothetical protein
MAIKLTDLSGTIIYLPELTSLFILYVNNYFRNYFDIVNYVTIFTSTDIAFLTTYADKLFYHNYIWQVL